MTPKSFLRAMLAAAGLACVIPALLPAATLGRVVPIGGQGADLALDEARGVLYIANFTANRVDVLSLSTNTIQTSINVAAQPSSLAISADGRYLVVAHFGNFAAPASPGNGLTVIDLNSNARQTFVLGNPPLGLAFGIDNRALIVTTQEFLLFDPVSGTTQVLDTITGLAAKTLPQPTGSFPPNIVAASVGASADGLFIYGFGDNIMFRFDVNTKALYGVLYTAQPPLGPRTVSVNQDGSRVAMGWAVMDRDLYDVAEFRDPGGLLNFGTVLIDSGRGLIYGQVASRGSTTPSALPQNLIMEIRDADNLTLVERIQLPENFAGRSILSSDGNIMYALSDSGVLILPVGQLNRAPRVRATAEDLVFRGNFCDRRVASQQLTIVDPGGNNVPFSLRSSNPGVRFSQASGVTPATVTVSVDPLAFQNQKGTSSVQIDIVSGAAVNIPEPVRVLINNREPDQRGTFVNVPGRLVDLLADPARDRFYILRQDKNQVLVFDGGNSAPIATLRTCTEPMGMAITFDRRNLLVGCNGSHYIAVFDLETLQPDRGIRMENGDYVQSLAASSRAILAHTRNASGGDPKVHRIDMLTRRSTRLPTLGIFENRPVLNTVLTASPNGSTILMASADGSLMLYDANVDNFTISRKDNTALSGAYAASSFDFYVVGNQLLNRSLVRSATLESASGTPSGFAFVDNLGFRTTAPNAAAPGVIQRVNLTSGVAQRSTRMAEAPLTGTTGAAFTRTLAPLYSRNAIVNLTVSGFTVLPWSYDDSVAPPRLTRVVNAADQRADVAPGGLISIFGADLSPVNVATRELPLPTALGESCLTVNGLPVPVLFVSPTQINAQLPFQTTGSVTMILRTPGGVSDNFNLTILPQAPSVFRAVIPGLDDAAPTIVRNANQIVVTDSNPIHRGDLLTIYLTGMGQTNPAVEAGQPAPASPVAVPLVAPRVALGNVELPVQFVGMAPGQIGVYQINVTVPRNVPEGLRVPFSVSQGGQGTSLDVRVVN
jgi:uncharacterized protein (TIGR03437 family)